MSVMSHRLTGLMTWTGLVSGENTLISIHFELDKYLSTYSTYISVSIYTVHASLVTFRCYQYSDRFINTFFTNDSQQ